MSFQERLLREQVEATKSGDRIRLNAIRMLRAELQNAAIAKKAGLTADEELAVLSREVKKRQESLEVYRQSGRLDLIADLQQEIAILQAYLPEQLSADELRRMVEQAIAAGEASSMKDMGKVMKLLMPQVKGRADGQKVRQIVEELLK